MNSKGSLLSDDAPQLRTPEAIHRKQEQIIDALDHGRITAKQAEQFNMSVKGLYVPANMRFRYLQMVAKYGTKTPAVTDPLLSEFLGLAPKVSFKALP